ncbi:MAG: hypothetical protein KatS3mg103_0958 [Phycisphaerales bacterium]|nr:MAG: hypothetical protein KatS3mg103_0958 [Phycisphaerales bacterium]
MVQMLAFGFVRFTDVRWTELQTPPVAQPLTVVTGEQAASRAERPGRAIRGVRQVQAEPVRVLSRWDHTLRVFTDASAAIGLVCAATLWLAVTLGVVVAGGASVPGVEQTVRACTWATVLALSALPMLVHLPGLRCRAPS